MIIITIIIAIMMPEVKVGLALVGPDTPPLPPSPEPRNPQVKLDIRKRFQKLQVCFSVNLIYITIIIFLLRRYWKITSRVHPLERIGRHKSPPRDECRFRNSRFVYYIAIFFLDQGPIFASPALWLTHWLTHSYFEDLIDVTLADE